MSTTAVPRLTQFAHGGGCACKIPPGELETLVAGIASVGATAHNAELLVGVDFGDDAAAIRIDGNRAILSTADFFTPVVDDPFEWGRIAAANALSDVYAMGGEPLLAINLMGWPRDILPLDVASEVMRGGMSVAARAGCHLAGGHSIDDPEPKYGLAVTGVADIDSLMLIDSALPGDPISLTKPLGAGTLNNRHKATGEIFADAIESMATLNATASHQAVAASIRAATDVTGFGLLGHLHKMARSSGVTAVIESAAVPYLAAARDSMALGYISGGTRRNLDWVRPHLYVEVDDAELLLLADAQTSGGLLLAGEIAAGTVIGSFGPPRDDGITIAIR